MPPKNDDRLKAIRENAAALRRRPAPDAPDAAPATRDEAAITTH